MFRFRSLIILGVFAAIAAVSLSLPHELNEVESNHLLLPDMEGKQIGIPTDELLRALDNQLQPQLQDFGMGRGANYFNLSSYLANPPNGTALTFIPLITLLLGIAQNAG